MSAKCAACQAASTAPKALREIADRVDAAVDSAVADHRAAAQGLRALADAISAGPHSDNFVAYHDGADCQPRINEAGLALHRGGDLVVDVLVADVDLPGHGEWTPELRAAAREQEATLPILETVAVYETAHGRRFIQPLAEPIPLAELERRLHAGTTRSRRSCSGARRSRRRSSSRGGMSAGGRAAGKSSATARPCPKCGFALWPVPVAPHLNFKDLRSTWATTAYEATGDIRFAQAGLGHSDSRVTERHYAAIRARHMVAQADKIRFGLEAPDLAATHNWLTTGLQTPNPPLLSESTGSMNLSTYDQRACPDSNRGPLASEARQSVCRNSSDVAVRVKTSGGTALAVAVFEQVSPLVAHPALTGAAPLLSVAEVARLLSVCEATVYGLVNRGELAHTRLLNNSIRIAQADLEAYLAARRTGRRR